MVDSIKSKQVTNTNVRDKSVMKIRLHAISSEQTGPAEWTLTFPIRELSPEQVEVLRDLFPNTMNTIERLLQSEVLLDSIAIERGF